MIISVYSQVIILVILFFFCFKMHFHKYTFYLYFQSLHSYYWGRNWKYFYNLHQLISEAFNSCSSWEIKIKEDVVLWKSEALYGKFYMCIYIETFMYVFNFYIIILKDFNLETIERKLNLFKKRFIESLK